MNRVILFGNVGRDPEVRSMANGDRVANLSLATSERWKDKGSGETKERTEWHRIVAFGPVVDVIEKYVTKGSKLLVEGKLQTRKWVDQGGSERYTTEIRLDQMQFGGSADRNEAGGDDGEPQQRRRSAAVKKSDPLDDDIPF